MKRGLDGTAGERGAPLATGAAPCYPRRSMRSILLVDDSRGVRKMLEACLQPWGFEVQHAENGAAALTLLKTARVDLVFLDINMPVLNGPSLLRILRSQGIDVPVVLVTSGAAMPVVASTVKLGAAEYVSKPFTPQQIRDVVARVLNLDLARLRQYRPSVLLQCGDDAFAQQLRALLPEHVAIEAAPQLTEALDLAEKKTYALVLLDAQVAEAAALLRERQPLAGILAVGAHPPADPLAAGEGPLDGEVPLQLGEEVVKDLLYANYLRPLVFAEGGTLRASGFEGPARNAPAYFRQLGRALAWHAEREAAAQPDVVLDLRRVPADAAQLVPLVQLLMQVLEGLGAAPAFALSAEQRALLAGRPEEARLVLVEPA